MVFVVVMAWVVDDGDDGDEVAGSWPDLAREGFHEIVDSRWNVNVEGFSMYRVVKRLKGLKTPFRKLLNDHGNLYKRVNRILVELDEAQKDIDMDPLSPTLHEEHAYYLLAFKEVQFDDERFLKQKAKVEWLKAGDSNTTYFYHIVKSKCARNMIEMISDASNNFYDGNQVPGAFVAPMISSLGSGPDGFTAAFFKKDWDVLGGDITCAI
uniref:RNA-directed DNA polymerase, eukaryota, reverse transcriptase zinc-binding domain protein n=1 Tax=Tanacetum cinerariifolium TaxID=118510 RepID=A0A6L2JU27_TANCI|nr:RNA-directed DNA polymerase, eukaryota, reverse transcriptase zinc-binding domain protein [Tanacetum cinerariifolium]